MTKRIRRAIAAVALVLAAIGVGTAAAPSPASATERHCVYYGPYWQPARWGVGTGYEYYVEVCWFSDGGWY